MFLPDLNLNSVEEFRNFNLKTLFEKEYNLSVGGSFEVEQNYKDFYELIIINGVPIQKSVPDFIDVKEEVVTNFNSWNPFVNINSRYNEKKYNLIFKSSSSKPVIIRNIFTEEKGYTPSNLKFTLGKNCRIDLLEISESDKNVLIISNREIDLKSSELNYSSIQKISHESNLIYNYSGELSNSRLNVVTYNDSGYNCINNWDVNLLTRGSVSNINGVVKLHSQMKHGTICKISHHDCETESSQEFRHILDDSSFAMYDGDSNMSDSAIDSSSSQQTKTIMLSDNARVLNKPRLNIYTGEVKATHGASVGKLNEDEIFYLKQRGFPDKIIRKMLINAFTDDLLDRIKSSTVKEVVYDKR